MRLKFYFYSAGNKKLHFYECRVKLVEVINYRLPHIMFMLKLYVCKITMLVSDYDYESMK